MDQGIKHAIKEFWERDLPTMHPRDISDMLDDDLIRDIVGPRRSGKTYLMYLLIKEVERRGSRHATIYLNFENRMVIPRKEKTFDDLLEFIHAEGLLEEFSRIYLFLDEVQNVKGWERYIRSIYDEFKGSIKIFVTGSCSDLLGEEYASLLTGRHLTREVFPLDFGEYLSFKGMDPSRALDTERDRSKAIARFDEYLLTGGFPEIVLDGPNSNMSSQLFTDIIARDITARVGVRNREALMDLADFLVRNVGGLLSFGKISRYFKSRMSPVSVPTLIRYFDMMKEAFLFFDATIFSYNVRDQKQYPRKIYCIDNVFLSGTGTGPLLENTVAGELLRRGQKLHYWRDRRGNYEVDFIIDKNGEKHPVQVCSNLEKLSTSEREFHALDLAMTELRSGSGTILTLNEEGERELSNGTVDLIPVWKWMLFG